MKQTDQILKKETSLGKRAMIGIVIGVAVFYILSLVLCLRIYNTARDIVIEQGVESTADIRQLNRDAVRAVGILWIMVFAANISTLSSMRRGRLRRIRETFYDDMLEIPNKKALGVIYNNLPEALLEQMYLVMFDVDKFKEYNYIHGSEGGDRLLRYLVSTLRDTSPEAYQFRYDSDWFVVMNTARDVQAYEAKVQSVLARFDRDIEAGLIPPFDVSAGIRKLQPGEPLRLAVSDAILARDTIKGNSLRHYAFYDEAIRSRRLSFSEMETDFPTALRMGEFQVYYQPRYDMRTGEITAAEALTRWIRRDGRILTARDFLTCFEANHQIILLNREILTQVCRQLREFQEEDVKVRPVSVNLSGVYLRQPNVLTELTVILRDSGIDPALVSFEIKASALLDKAIPMGAILEHLHGLGCRTIIDDYGMGAATPDVLLSNQFDMLKLGESFVKCIGDGRVEDIIRSTVYMARKWGMEVMAEGAEEQHQARRLVELGCSQAQGSYYSMPMTAEAYRELLLSGDESAGARIQAESLGVSCYNWFSEEFCIALDTTELPIYIVDADTYEVVYCNEFLRRYLGRNPLGELCHRALRAQDAPCTDCAMKRLIEEGVNEAAEYSVPDGSWIMVQVSPLHWHGRKFYKITCLNITRQKQLEEELRLANREYGAVVRHSTAGIMRYNLVTGEVTLNIDSSLNRVEEHTLSSQQRMAFIKKMVAPDSQPVAKKMFQSIQAGRPSCGYEIQLLPEQSSPRWCQLDYTLIEDEGGKPYRAVVSFTDVTEQRERELAYQRWSRRLNTIMDEYTVYLGVNLSRDVIEMEGRSGAWDRDEGGRCYSEAMKNKERDDIFVDDRLPFRTFFHREMLLGQFLAGELEQSLEYRIVIEGVPRWHKAEIQLASDPATGDVKASVLISNVDVVQRERELLSRKADQDVMTGIYNHATTEKLIGEVLAENSGERCCLLIIDLDDLRDINNSLGHPEGDRALMLLADCMRQHFGADAILGRIGGDEFAALLRKAPEQDELDTRLTGFIRRVNSCRIGPANDREVHASVGAAVGFAGAADFKTLYHQADLALYYTKASGKNDFHFYTPELEARNFHYQPLGGATLTEADSFDSAEFQKLLQAVSAYFPMVISVNLTRNSYYMMEYASYAMKRHRDHGNFDQLIEDGAASFHPEDRESFVASFSRKSLLAAYARGEKMVRHLGRQLGDDGIYRLTQGVVIFTKDTATGDICEITFSHTLSALEGGDI